jgi:hypothetical protein
MASATRSTYVDPRVRSDGVLRLYLEKWSGVTRCSMVTRYCSAASAHAQDAPLAKAATKHSESK